MHRSPSHNELYSWSGRPLHTIMLSTDKFSQLKVIAEVKALVRQCDRCPLLLSLVTRHLVRQTAVSCKQAGHAPPSPFKASRAPADRGDPRGRTGTHNSRQGPACTYQQLQAGAGAAAGRQAHDPQRPGGTSALGCFLPGLSKLALL